MGEKERVREGLREGEKEGRVESERVGLKRVEKERGKGKGEILKLRSCIKIQNYLVKILTKLF